MVNGNTVKTLSPGVHMFWKFNRVIEVKQYDLRLQAMEVNGQEILTKDRVSLRINCRLPGKLIMPSRCA